jgi:hypothetical protein
MEAFDLEFVKFDKELFDEIVKDIVALAHEFGSLFLCHQTRLVHLRCFKVREE